MNKNDKKGGIDFFKRKCEVKKKLQTIERKAKKETNKQTHRKTNMKGLRKNQETSK